MKFPGQESDFGSALLGSATDTPRRRRIRIQLLITVSVLTANAIGAGIAILLVVVGIPEPSVLGPELWWVNYIAVPVYVAVAFGFGWAFGTSRVLGHLQWALRDEQPTPEQARWALRAPWVLTRMQMLLWFIAGVFFTLCYGILDPGLIPKIALVVGLSGAVVCAISYLLVEFALRPVAAQALEAGYPGTKRRSRLRTRATLSWVLGSGIPIVGTMLVAFFSVLRDTTTKTDVFVAVMVLGVIGLFTGLLLNYLSISAIKAPVGSVRRAMTKVSGGDNDVRVVVYDGTELGDLQRGFNLMVTGLGERERMRDLFGRHVGRDVAEAALAQNPELGGTERFVAIVFIDVIGSTAIAASRPPNEVVTLLNKFFAVVVSAVESHSGLVNKFQGDAVLAAFGAPLELDDPATAALSTAREISVRLAGEIPELAAGIGVAYGSVVAGNIGAIQRFEYTVIGDAVNEAARLSEYAKQDPSRPVASGRAIASATDTEAAQWSRFDSILLRGRSEETEIFAAVADTDHPTSRGTGDEVNQGSAR